MVTAIVAIIVFGLLVFIHELGHFGVAKWVGIKVHEFAIGMGPKIVNFKKGETTYSLRLLPLGGYVRMEGEDEKSNDQRSFNNKPVLHRIGVVIAGPIMNIILGVILFTVIFYNITGVPTTTINDIAEDSPAHYVDVQPGDEIVSVNNKKISTWDNIVEEINMSQGETINVELLRDNEVITKRITPIISEDTNQYMIGIYPVTNRSVMLAIENSLKQTRMIITGIFDFFRGLIVRQENVLDDVVGPVGIISLVSEASRAGWIYVTQLAGLISINLAIMNLLPIPALDGSRILFLIVEAFRGRPIDPEKEGMIHIIGFTLLILMMIMVTYKDITGLFV
ncbi:RIP metalloprotease RseP [Serpentinicella sp. ANB-PHB4]|uniref:RIP metalloprotease RseP n=1 Tax=Serpentinicella sp. ANB-PHB4 TaxID=3074076 RepID=UPI00285503B5|nr:RIP metalloprotease RseP [Serpentinicella sp. ANB-PHB4]MDR5658228.1 RIP metalloprotease RseP [Serpentinicella sp. ANB-PHB4]